MARHALRATLGAALFALPLAARPTGAHAAGFYMTDRGVRGMGRAGAFVAGVDDQHAVWYNPAGLSQAGSGFLLDGSYLGFTNSYRREAQGDGGGPIVHYPEVHGTASPLVIPTLIVSHNFGLRQWNFAAGVYAPNAVLASYPDGDTAPQRYSLYNLNGSLLAFVGAWAAWSPSPQFSIGAGVQALVGTFASRLALSACPATITCQPEDPDWDAVAQVNAGPIIAPTGNVGVRWQPARYVVFGLSGSLPVYVAAPATLQVRLPSAAYFDGAMVHGDQANVSFWLPPIVRAGVEVRPGNHTRIEAAFGIEFWGVHDQITLSPAQNDMQPSGIQITGVRGVGTYDVGQTAIRRNFQTSFSVHLGGEQDIPIGPEWHLIPRLGVMYETSATAPENTSVLTQDADKFVTSVGLSFGNRHWRFDLGYAHSFSPTVAVDPRDAMLYQVAPFRQSDQAPQHAINGGQYDMALNVFGAGLRYTF